MFLRIGSIKTAGSNLLTRTCFLHRASYLKAGRRFLKPMAKLQGSSKGLSSKLARAGLRSERRNVGKKVRGWVGIAVVTANTAEIPDF